MIPTLPISSAIKGCATDLESLFVSSMVRAGQTPTPAVRGALAAMLNAARAGALAEAAAHMRIISPGIAADLEAAAVDGLAAVIRDALPAASPHASPSPAS